MELSGTRCADDFLRRIETPRWDVRLAKRLDRQCDRRQERCAEEQREKNIQESPRACRPLRDHGRRQLFHILRFGRGVEGGVAVIAAGRFVGFTRQSRLLLRSIDFIPSTGHLTADAANFRVGIGQGRLRRLFPCMARCRIGAAHPAIEFDGCCR